MTWPFWIAEDGNIWVKAVRLSDETTKDMRVQQSQRDGSEPVSSTTLHQSGGGFSLFLFYKSFFFSIFWCGQKAQLYLLHQLLHPFISAVSQRSCHISVWVWNFFLKWSIFHKLWQDFFFKAVGIYRAEVARDCIMRGVWSSIWDLFLVSQYPSICCITMLWLYTSTFVNLPCDNDSVCEVSHVSR